MTIQDVLRKFDFLESKVDQNDSELKSIRKILRPDPIKD
jgi:hypothetical protein